MISGDWFPAPLLSRRPRVVGGGVPEIGVKALTLSESESSSIRRLLPAGGTIKESSSESSSVT